MHPIKDRQGRADFMTRFPYHANMYFCMAPDWFIPCDPSTYVIYCGLLSFLPILAFRL